MTIKKHEVILNDESIAAEETAATVFSVKEAIPTENLAEEENTTEEENTDTDFQIRNLTITFLKLEKSSPVLADKIIKLNPKEHKVFFDFFKTHVGEARYGRNTRECSFSDRDNSILTKIKRYKDSFTEESFLIFANDITKNLFSIMKTSSTKSNGSFFILDATFKEEDFIVFIKLDPKDGVQLDPDTLDLKQISNMLPESNDRVHKCALIKPTFVSDTTNLFVLDRQQKSGEASKFFMSTFLQALPIPNNKMKTLAVITELYEKISPNLPGVDDGIIHNAIESELSNGVTIHIPVTVQNIYNKLLPEDLQDRDILLEHYKDEFVTQFTTKYKDYGTSFEVVRDENTLLYKADSNKIVFKYNKFLNNNEVKVQHDKVKDVYTITINNNPQINFGKTFK